MKLHSRANQNNINEIIYSFPNCKKKKYNVNFKINIIVNLQRHCTPDVKMERRCGKIYKRGKRWPVFSPRTIHSIIYSFSISIYIRPAIQRWHMCGT